jgi:cytosine/adenosine deaminase-related metal-dependent hydrolase
VPAASITRLRSEWVLGFDGQDHVLLRDAEVVFSGGTIRFVGIGWAGRIDQDRDLGRSLLMPGFIDLNALGDIDHMIFKFDLPQEMIAELAWSEAYVARGPRDVLSVEETLTGARYALAQLIRNGITTALPVTSLLARAWAEGFDEFAAIAEVAAELGLRTYLGPSFRSAVHVIRADGTSGLHTDIPRGEAGLRAAIRFVETFDGTHDGLIRGLLVPSTIDTCEPMLIRVTAEAARRLGVPMRLHRCQSAREVRMIYEQFGRTSIEHLEALGALGPRVLLPHAVELGGPGAERAQQDLDRLIESGSSIVYCPLVMARHGRVLRGLGRLCEQRASIGLGTDTAPPDMLRNLQVGLEAARIADPDGPPVRVNDLIRTATLGGARALGRDDLGRLARGARADIIAIDLGALHHGPIHDPVQTLFLSATGRDVTDVWIEGRQAMCRREVPGLDLAALHGRAQEILEKLRTAYPERDRKSCSAAMLFPPSFQPGRLTSEAMRPQEERVS